MDTLWTHYGLIPSSFAFHLRFILNKKSCLHIRKQDFLCDIVDLAVKFYWY